MQIITLSIKTLDHSSHLQNVIQTQKHTIFKVNITSLLTYTCDYVMK